MRARLVQFSSVVVGKSHNPSILNPDWLANESIVPKSWGWNIEERLTTPPLSLVRYENGVAITVEQEKLQVTDPNVEEGPKNSKVAEIASAYVNTLPHVTYKAVGFNFQSVIAMDDPEVYLQNRFLKSGPWNQADPSLEGIGIRLLFPYEQNGRFTLTVDVATANLRDKSDAQPVLVVNANFNRNCQANPGLDEAKEFLKKKMADWVKYNGSLCKFFELEHDND